MKEQKYKIIKSLSAIILCVMCYAFSYAQSSSLGNTFIHNNGEMVVNGITHNFLLGAGLIQKGIIGTERGLNRGFFSFTNNGDHKWASDTTHVDGYVRTYNPGYFVFPIGDDNKMLPAAITASSITAPTDAAYFHSNPTIARTSSLKGGLEPILPVGGPFNIASRDVDVSAVDKYEYWDVNGTTAAKLTLSWNKFSEIVDLTSADLKKLIIVGWDGTKWVKIPSKPDSLSMFGVESDFFKGSITTLANIIPNTYNVYTLANGCISPVGIPKISCKVLTNCDTVCITESQKKYYVSGMTNTTGYKWSVSNGATIVTGQYSDTIVVNFTSATAGIATVCVRPFNNCDTLKDSCKSIFIQTIPGAPNAGVDQLVCNGSPFSITATGLAGAKFTWIKPNGTQSTLNPYSVAISTKADSGMYIVSQSLGGCPSLLKDTVYISVLDWPGYAFSTTDTSTICETNTKTLTATPAGGAWTIISGGGVISGNIYTPANIAIKTRVTVRYTMPAIGSCPSTFSSTSFDVVPVDSLINSTTTTSICELSTKQLIGTPAGGTWTIISGGGSIIGNTYYSPVVTANTNVTIRYSISTANLCPNPNANVTFTIIDINNSIPVVTLPATGGNQQPDLNKRICVNGKTVTVGPGSGSIIKSNGTWPAGVTIDSITGKVIVKTGTSVGTYTLLYTLCDSVRPIPNCKTDTIIVKVTPVIDPKTDTGSITSSGGVAIANVTANDSVNGNKATLGSNAVISQSGTWPSNFKLDPITGKVTVTGPVPFGTYTLFYTLCDTFKPIPNCKNGVIIIKVKGIRPDTITIIVNRYDTLIDICTTIDDLKGSSGSFTYNGGPIPKGYTVVGPDANGCYRYQPDSLYAHTGNSYGYQVVCVNGVCDTTFVIFVPRFKDWIVPNYFSPNNDGANDKWVLPDVLFKKYPNLSAIIYNRWGNIVWRSHGKYNNDWAGTSQGTNDIVPDGVYYYLLELDANFGKTKSGFVEIMR
jgi:gliding motility-associated-like protein